MPFWVFTPFFTPIASEEEERLFANKLRHILQVLVLRDTTWGIRIWTQEERLIAIKELQALMKECLQCWSPMNHNPDNAAVKQVLQAAVVNRRSGTALSPAICMDALQLFKNESAPLRQYFHPTLNAFQQLMKEVDALAEDLPPASSDRCKPLRRLWGQVANNIRHRMDLHAQREAKIEQHHQYKKLCISHQLE